MRTPTGMESVVYWYKDAKPRRKAIAKQKPATMPLVKSPQKITVVHRIPAKIPTAAVINRIYWISRELLIKHIRYVRSEADENPVAKRVILWYLKPVLERQAIHSELFVQIN